MMKKLSALFLISCLLLTSLSITIFAATNDGAFNRSTNIQFYTPTSCSVTMYDDTVHFSTLQWNTNQFAGAHYWEGELRGHPNSSAISNAYSGVTAVSGSLPGLYKEYDKDDMSIGSSCIQNISTNQYYYATLNVVKGPSFNSGVDVIFESEFGTWLIIDGLPSRYQTYDYIMNTASGNRISWIS